MQRLPYVTVCERRPPECLEADADDVIDLGAPRVLRRDRPAAEAAAHSRRVYVPNPRLYPGRPPNALQRPRRTAGHTDSGRPRQRKRVLRRPVPNSRLYRPAPPRPPPAPARPRAAWPPPTPLQPLDTASRVALRLREQRQAGRAYCPQPHSTPVTIPGSPPKASEPARSRHLVVTLPAAGGGDTPAPTHYRAASEHFRARASTPGGESGASTPPAGRVMDATASRPRREPSPDHASDGNESPSAPSEYLAEFLSAIMRRQYAEALKYCRLILQYEPQNSTARGFHPLLMQKVVAGRRGSGSGSEAEGSSCSPGSDSEAEEGSSLELRSEGSSQTSAEHSESASASCSGLSAARWDTSRSDADDNGNLMPPPLDSHGDTDADLENDNTNTAAGAGDARLGDTRVTAHIKGEAIATSAGAAGGVSSTSLRRLRAQFACSIK